MEKDQQFLESMLREIVEHPNEAEVKREVDDLGILLTIKVNKSDMGLVIGKRGINANAIKLIMKLIGYRNNNHISIKIEEPNE
jgi:hypothetical protein